VIDTGREIFSFGLIFFNPRSNSTFPGSHGSMPPRLYTLKQL